MQHFRCASRLYISEWLELKCFSWTCTMIRAKQYYIENLWKIEFDAKTGCWECQDLSIHMTLNMETTDVWPLTEWWLFRLICWCSFRYCSCDHRSEETLKSVEKNFLSLSVQHSFLIKVCFQNKNIPFECLKDLATGAALQ